MTGPTQLGGDVLAHPSSNMGIAVLRAVTVLALYVGHPRRSGVLFQHLGPVAYSPVRCFPTFCRNGLVEAVVINIGGVANRMATGTSQAPVTGRVVDVLLNDFSVARRFPSGKLVGGYGVIVTRRARLIGYGLPILVLAGNNAHPGTGKNVKGGPTR